MDFATTFSFLVALTDAIIELLKATFKAFGLLADDQQREVVIRYLAVLVGVLFCLAFDFSAVNAENALIGRIATGFVIGLGSDILHIGTDLGKGVVNNLNTQAQMAASPPPPPGDSVTIITPSSSQP